MSTIGYNGNELIILLDDTKIAAVRTKTQNFQRTQVDVTTDDSDGWQTLLPRPGVRAFNVDVGGVSTSDNIALFTNVGSDAFLDVTVQLPNGETIDAEEGFFLGNITITAVHDNAVEFTAQLMSSGPVTKTAAPADPD